MTQCGAIQVHGFAIQVHGFAIQVHGFAIQVHGFHLSLMEISSTAALQILFLLLSFHPKDFFLSSS